MRLQGTGGDNLDALIAAFEDLVMRIVHRIADAATRLLGGTPDPVHPYAVSVDDLGVIRAQWLQHLDVEVLPALGVAFGEAASSLVGDLAAAGRDVAALSAPDAAAFLSAARNRLVGVGDRLWEAARDGLAEGLRAGEDIGQLSARVRGAADVAEPRARVIARSEVVAANNAASLAQARLLDDPSVVKEWISTPDGRTRESHRLADGQRVRIGDRFAVGAAHLDFPGDPASSHPEETANCRCSIALDLDDEPAQPVTASADMESEQTVADPTPPDAPAQPDPVAAAAAGHTGAMVALIPTDADAQRLAVDGGEPVDELHCTLMYLGEAADIPDDARTAITDAVRSYVDGWPPVQAEAFAVSMFNPPGMDDSDGKQRESCVVLGLSGEDLDMVHDMVTEAVNEVAAGPAGFTLPEQHAPWIPHTTLVYSEDPGQVASLVDRVGPVTFDRVRVVFGDDATDIPLNAPQPDAVVPDDGEPASEAATVAAVGALHSHMPAHLQRYWLRRLAPWGHGSFKRCVRALRKHYPKDPEGACANLHKEATGRWPGAGHHADDGGTTMADMPTPEPTAPAPAAPAGCPEGQHRDPDSGDCVPDEDAATGPVEHFHAIMHVEGVSTGMRTFVPGSLTWREPPFAFHWQRGSSAHSGTPETVQVGNVTRAERDGDTIHGWGPLDLGCAEGLDYARRLVEGFARWVSIGLDESLKESDIEYVWPNGETAEGEGVEMLFAEPEEMIFHAGRIAELSGVSIPAQAEAVIEPTQALVDALAEMGVLVAAAVGAHDTATSDGAWDAAARPIVAAGHIIEIPDCPPAWWFNEPVDVTPHGALTITDEGRIYGYLAPAGVAHRAFPDRRVTAPMGRVDYDRWMGGEAIVAGGGRVVAGPITMECGHMPPAAADRSDVRMQHYDNACSVVAKARVGENRHGVWIAGALEPGVSADQVSRMMACRLSGDWAPHPERAGWREFCAALLVPVPGFPMARSAPSVRVAEGALVASAVPVRVVHADVDVVAVDAADLRPVLERVARSIGRDASTRLQALRNRVHANN